MFADALSRQQNLTVNPYGCFGTILGALIKTNFIILFLFLIANPNDVFSQGNDCPEGLVNKVLINNEIANYRRPDGFTYLAMAVYTHRPQCVKFLISNGAEVNSSFGEYKITSLYLASENGFDDLINILLDNGADIDSRHSYGGCSSLCIALIKKHEKVANILIDRGADLYNMNKSGASALHLAAQNGLVSTTKLLLNKGMDVNLKTNNKFGVSPLQDGALEGQIEIVKLLLSNGASVNQISKSGYTPLDDAIGAKSKEIIELLKKHGAKTAKELTISNHD